MRTKYPSSPRRICFRDLQLHWRSGGWYCELRNVKGRMFSQKSVAIVDFSTILVTRISHFPLCLFFSLISHFSCHLVGRHIYASLTTCLQLIAQVHRCKHSLLLFLHMKKYGYSLVFTEGKGLILLTIAITGQSFV